MGTYCRCLRVWGWSFSITLMAGMVWNAQIVSTLQMTY